MLERADKLDGTHFGLSNELMVPALLHNDMQRINMFDSHFDQSSVLVQPEPPLFFSGFENSIGAYSSVYKYATEPYRVVDIFELNENHIYYRLMSLDGERTKIFEILPVKHLTEKYGYKYDNSTILSFQVGDIIPENTPLRSWSCTDEFGNMQYGRNFTTMYAFFKGFTYEDAIVISQTAALSMSHTSVRKIDVMLNLNDILINKYGSEGIFKGFADINEDIVDGVLAVTRRIDHANIGALSDEALSTVLSEYDTSYYATGTVVNIEVFSNVAIEKLEGNAIYEQLIKYIKRTEEAKLWLKNACIGIDEKPSNFIDETGFIYRRMTDEGRWSYNESEYDGILIRFTVAKEEPVYIGSKLTNRYGGKGIVSLILPDDQMPITKDGERVHIICNAGGIWARQNIGQLYEHSLNHAAACIVRKMRSLPFDEAKTLFIDFMTHISPTRHEVFFEKVRQTDTENDTNYFDSYVHEVMESGEVYINYPPMFDVLGLDGLEEMYSKFDIQFDELVGIKRPQIIGKIYYMKLRHEPSSKFSARSASHLSVTSLPTKNNRDTKNYTAHHSTTAIRLGEQEIENLAMSPKIDRIGEFIKVLSTDEVARESYMRQLVTEAPLNPELDISYSGSKATMGLKAFINAIGVDLVFVDPEKEGNSDV